MELIQLEFISNVKRLIMIHFIIKYTKTLIEESLEIVGVDIHLKVKKNMRGY